MENGSSSDKPLMQHSEIKHDDKKPLVEVTTTSALSPLPSSPLTSSSSESSLELSAHPKPLEDLHTKSEQDASLSPSSSPDVSTHTPQWSMISASPRGGSTESPPFSAASNPNPDWNGASTSPMTSPPVQHTMGPPGYDPNRIPLSVFSTKPTTTAEWSVASNESLFSIQMGNNSFCRDQSSMYKSGELIKPEEWNNSPSNPYYVSENERKSFSSNLPPLVEVATYNEVKSASALEGPGMQEKKAESPKVVPEVTSENNIKEQKTNVIAAQHSSTASAISDGKVPTLNETSHTSPPRLSNESGNSSSSFAFPVLLNDSGKNGSLNAASGKIERPQPQPQQDSQPELQRQSQPQPQSQSQPQNPQPASQPKAAETNWFSCISCWPRCC